MNALAWKYLQPNPTGGFLFSEFDQWMDAHYAAGRDMIFELGYPPDWAVSGAVIPTSGYGSGSKANQPPDNDTDWINYVTAVATQGLGKIKYYQVWNEPEHPAKHFYAGSPERLAELTRLAHQTIKAIDPTAKILSTPCGGWGSVSWQGSESLGLFTTKQFLSASDGAGGSCLQWVDIVCMHLYEPAWSNLWNADLMIDGPAGLRKALQDLSAGNKPIWIDEVGFEAPAAFSSFTVAQRQALMQRLMFTLAGTSLERFIWYCWDAGSTGFANAPDVQQTWIDTRTFLLSGPVTKVSKLMDGRISATVNGQTRISS